jgi:hypothetical protein
MSAAWGDDGIEGVGAVSPSYSTWAGMEGASAASGHAWVDPTIVGGLWGRAECGVLHVSGSSLVEK